MLTDIKLRSLKPRAKLYRVADTGGLCIEVAPTGSKLWRFRYRVGGKASMLSLGSYPEVTLIAARAKRDAVRSTLRGGVDPAGERRRAKTKAAHDRANTFAALATEWLEVQRKGKAKPATITKAEWLLGLLTPSIGLLTIDQIEPADLLTPLRALVDRGTVETAHRALHRAGQVMRYAVQTGRAKRNPAADLRGALPQVKVTPRAAVTDPAEIGELLRKIDGYPGAYATRCALQLAPLVFVRPGELRGAEWAEIDLDAGEWIIPGARMKMGEDHAVPLAPQAVAILRKLHDLTGNGRLVFPSGWQRDKPMSENTLNTALRRMGFASDTMTAHGFRALASTRLNELGFRADVIERQLAHAERNKVRAAYNRAEYMPERRKMMGAWADYLDGLRAGGNVIPMKRAAKR